MSGKLVSLVHGKALGSPVRKAVMVFCADKADDQGRCVWASKSTIAEATEFGRSTVIRAINEFVAEGLLVPVGEQPGKHGPTVVYDIGLERLAALPKNKAAQREHDQSPSGTSPAANQPPCGTSPAAAANPSRSGTQTVLEPSNGDGGGRAHEAQTTVIPIGSPTFRDRLLAEMGLDSTGVVPVTGRLLGKTGDMAIASQWLALDLSEDECVQVVGEVIATKPDGLPSTFKYFTGAMERLAAAKRTSAEPRVTTVTHIPAPQQRRSSHDQLSQTQRAIARMARRTGHFDVQARLPGHDAG